MYRAFVHEYCFRCVAHLCSYIPVDRQQSTVFRYVQECDARVDAMQYKTPAHKNQIIFSFF